MFMGLLQIATVADKVKQFATTDMHYYEFSVDFDSFHSFNIASLCL